MKKRLLSAFLAISMVLGMMPTTAFAEDAPAVVYGMYEDGGWKQKDDCEGILIDEDTGIQVSKIAKPVEGKENTYEINLEVKTSTTTTVSDPSAAAVVLVVDLSNSMKYCATCAGSGSHKNSCTHSGSVDVDENRLTAAKNAALDFLEGYAGDSASATRQLAVVAFGSTSKTVLSWANVAGGTDKNSYDDAVDAINGLSIGFTTGWNDTDSGGTNLDAGVRLAANLVAMSSVSNISAKNVVVLTDGIPTYRLKSNASITSTSALGGDGSYSGWDGWTYDDVAGSGSGGSSDNNTSARNSATAVKQNAKLYTVCFGVANDKCYNNGPTVGGFLSSDVASPAENTTDDDDTNDIIYAYDADDADELYAAFEAITDSITEGITGSGLTVTDPMTGIVDNYAADGVIKLETEDGFKWELSDPVVDTTETEDGTVTTYTYSLTYTIVLDTTAVDFVEGQYYPTNKDTYLTIPGAEGEDDTIVHFPIPAVTGLKPTFTVKYDNGDHGALSGQDNNGQVVHSNIKMHTETPEAPAVTPDAGYYFIGWEEEIAETVTENVTYTAQYSKLTDVKVVGDSKTETYNGTEQSITTYTVTGLPADYTLTDIAYEAKGTDVGTYTGSFTDNTPVIKDADGKDVTYQFAVSFENGQLVINKREIAITADTSSKTYDGTALTDSGYEITGSLASGDAIESVTVTGSQTTVGSSANTPSAAVIKDGETEVTPNYNITYVPGTLTVVKDEAATIEIKAYTGIYDGDAHDALTSVILRNGNKGVLNNADWTITYKYGGETFTSMPKFTDAGSYEVTVEATNDNYNTVTATATAVISKKQVTLTSPTKSQTYNGNALTGTEIEAVGFVKEEGVTYSDHASILDVGTIDNTFTYAAKEGTNLNNYEIQVVNGTLTVTPIATQIIITANSDAKVYDGSALTNSGYTYTDDVLVSGDVLTAVVEGSQTNAGSSANKVTSYVIKRGEKDVTANYTFGDSVPGVLTVEKKAVKLTSGSATKEYDGQPLTATDIAADGFVEGEGATYSDHASITDAGQTENSFKYTLNANTKADNYTITTEFGTLKINASDDAVLTVNGYTGKYDGEEHTVTTSVTGDVEGTKWTYEYKVDGGEYSDELPQFTDVGVYNVTVKISNPNYASKEGSAVVTITERNVTLTSGSASRPYNGEALMNETVTVSGDGFVEGEGAEYSDFASIVDVGTEDNTFEYDLWRGTKADNYNITVVEGTLEVTKYTENLVITAKSNSKTYDGLSLQDAGYTANTDKLVAGDVLTDVIVEGSQTDVGSSANVVTSFKIMRGDVDVTDNYDSIEVVDGTLTVTKRDVTLTSGNAEKVYDGTALTYDGVTATGFVGEQGATYNVTGSQTYVGESDNTFTYTLKEGTNKDNYNITVVFGTLKVTEYTDTITIIADGNEKVYDGDELTDDGFTYTGKLVEGDEVTAVVEGTITDVGQIENKVVSYKILRGETDVTSNYKTIATQDGTLKVTARPVTLTSATDSKVYDGEALTNDEITVGGQGFVDGEGAEYTVTGTQTEAGSSKNTFSYELDENTKADNYTITTSEGTLTVLPVESVVVTITGKTDTVTYDGKEHKVEGYTFSCTDPLYKESDFTFSGTAVAKGTETGTYEMGLNSTQFTNKNKNFKAVTFIVNDGSLTINPISDEVVVTITENSGTENYDGTVKSVTGYEVTSISNALYTKNDFTFSGAAEVKGVNPGVYNMELKASDFQNTSKNFSNVKFVIVDGTLTINPQVTVEYYLEDLEGNTTKIEAVDNGQNNPFIVNYGEGFTIVIGEGEGTYKAPAAVTADNISYVFDSAVEALSADKVTENVTVKLYYSIDNWNDEEDDDNKKDDIADKYQAKVTYKVSGGTWDGTDASNKIAVFTMYTYEDGVWTAISPAPVLKGTIPDVSKAQPDADHTTPAYWSPAPYATDKVVNGAEYVYTFTAKGNELTFTFDANGGAWTAAVEGYTMGDGNVTAAKEYYFLDNVAKIGTEPTREGYEFIGWYSKNTNGDLTAQWWIVDQMTHMIIEDTTVYAKWEKLPEEPEEPAFEATLLVNCQTETGASLKYEEIALTDAAWTYTPDYLIVDGADRYIYEGITAYSPAQSLNGTAKNGETILLILDYTLDNWNDKEDKEEGGDGIPDKYQAKVTYVVVNGTWDGTDTEEKIEIFTVKTKDAETGEWTNTGVTLKGTIPTGMQPDSKHIAPGAWDVAITDETPVTESVTYTYTFDIEKILKLDVDKKVDKTSVKVGGTVTYTITVENTGNVALTDVIVTDDFSGDISRIKVGELPEGVTYSGMGVFVIDEMDPAEIVTIQFSYQTKSADKGTLTNTVVAESDPGDGNDPVEDEDEADDVDVERGSRPDTPDVPQLNREDHFAYIVGFPDGLVHPEKNITRAEVATIFFRMLLDESREDFWSQENWFPDVTPDMWCNNAISTLANAGLITGYPNGNFGPYDNITRAEFATIAVRFFLEDDVELTENNLSDVKGHWAEANINLAHALNLITGYPDGTFKPDQQITRAEAMTIVNRVLKRAPHEDYLLPDMIVWPDNMDKRAWYYEAVQEATNSHEFNFDTTHTHEIWTKLLPVRDWVALEQAWSNANSSGNPGEVVDINTTPPLKD